MGDRGVQDSRRRAADLAVAGEEARSAGPVEVRDHDLDRDERDREPSGGDRGSLEPVPARNCVPEPEAGDDEADLLLADRCGQREQREGKQAVLVQVPHREQQQRAGEGDRMELVERQPLGRRVEQVGEREGGAGPLRAEVLAGEPEDGQRTEGDRDRLGDEQGVRARPDEPERREGGEDRVEVGGEPRDLVPAQAGHGQRVPVRRRPDGLHHVAEVEAPGLQGAVAQNREGREAGGVGAHRGPDDGSRSREAARGHGRGDRTARVRSRSSRQRPPSTSSLAPRR